MTSSYQKAYNLLLCKRKEEAEAVFGEDRLQECEELAKDIFSDFYIFCLDVVVGRFFYSFGFIREEFLSYGPYGFFTEKSFAAACVVKIFENELRMLARILRFRDVHYKDSSFCLATTSLRNDTDVMFVQVTVRCEDLIEECRKKFRKILAILSTDF